MYADFTLILTPNKAVESLAVYTNVNNNLALEYCQKNNMFVQKQFLLQKNKVKRKYLPQM